MIIARHFASCRLVDWFVTREEIYLYLIIMSLFSTNRFKNLSAEYVEESLKVQKETTEAKENDKTVDIIKKYQKGGTKECPTIRSTT